MAAKQVIVICEGEEWVALEANLFMEKLLALYGARRKVGETTFSVGTCVNFYLWPEGKEAPEKAKWTDSLAFTTKKDITSLDTFRMRMLLGKIEVNRLDEPLMLEDYLDIEDPDQYRTQLLQSLSRDAISSIVKLILLRKSADPKYLALLEVLQPCPTT